MKPSFLLFIEKKNNQQKFNKKTAFKTSLNFFFINVMYLENFFLNENS